VEIYTATAIDSTGCITTIMMAASAGSPPHQSSSNGLRRTNLGRSDSLVSLARAPFSVQLHRLTSLSLPTPDSLHSRILDAKTPSESLSHLRNIATDVQKWINTANTVLGQLDADDDVEWAARGKDSLAKVENAAKRFGEIVEMFLDAATVLSARSDDRVKEEIKELISIMDDVTRGWTGVRELIQGLKEQVALSTEWMEIREILEDISSELDVCANMVFELEEKRHLSNASTSVSAGSNASAASSSVELDRLSTLLEQHTASSHAPPSPGNPHQTSLLRLSARIQPLRASLDFLKPRLSSFGSRAEKPFPSALAEVLQRKADLERRWTKIEADWRSISRELQEDEWVQVFRNVGKQVFKSSL
jgi:Yeast cortical protein KAR9